MEQPLGRHAPLYDPENNPDGVVHAVIDDEDSNINYALDVITLTSMSVYGPPAYDGSSFSSIAAQVAQIAPDHQYIGEQDMFLLRANGPDSGTIIGSTFQGGPIQVTQGPWTIANNTVLGATAYYLLVRGVLSSVAA